ncbi:hypothetical protein IE53DRAFT_372404, partial [Violaceomyces palustris]
MKPEHMELIFTGAIHKIGARDSPLLRAYIAHFLFTPGQTPYRSLTQEERARFPEDPLSGYAGWAALSIHPSEDSTISRTTLDCPGSSSLSAPSYQADYSYNMAYAGSSRLGPKAQISHRRQRSDTSLGLRKSEIRSKTSGGSTSKMPASVPATPARQARPSIPPSPRSLRVAERENILRRWVPCTRCTKFGRTCVPPIAGDTKQVRCQNCQDDRSHPACSSGRRLFGKQNRRDHHLPGGSTWTAIELSSDEDFEILKEAPTPRHAQRERAGSKDENHQAPQNDLPARVPRQTSAPATLPSVPAPLPPLRLPFSPGELVDELEDD